VVDFFTTVFIWKKVIGVQRSNVVVGGAYCWWDMLLLMFDCVMNEMNSKPKRKVDGWTDYGIF
jgi:hypothetical protein